ncbi:hypothetical protein [Actinomycetospora termitidis]|uniref:DUF559 domain-containing protein n=1 Tax=Actinomycetospora termitidis TaxID=3053470 RepID=A0ABT7MEN6_9PSEU|nr:hypothetical protein [Actinomycetospora sp. Odt1-22]MDL5159126.1 hypothetical protein [Actinomycetospora sp. Odt1-22]
MPFRGSLAVELGLITWDRLLGPDFVRLHPDVYVGAGAEIDTRVRVGALSTWSRDVGVVAGPLAALAWGADCPWEDAEIVVDRRLRLPDTRIRRDQLSADEVATWFGHRLTTPVRTAFDLARREPFVEAVAAADSIAHVTRFPASLLARFADRYPKARGIVQVRRVCAAMDPRAESLPETRLRLGLLERGVPPAVSQLWVTLLTGERRRLDLAWPDSMFALEYNGLLDHGSSTQQNSDAFRTGRLSDIGWEVLPVTSAMIMDMAAFDELGRRVLRKVA